jgi:hypothetical protein
LEGGASLGGCERIPVGAPGHEKINVNVKFSWNNYIQLHLSILFVRIVNPDIRKRIRKIIF